MVESTANIGNPDWFSYDLTQSSGLVSIRLVFKIVVASNVGES